MFIQSRLAVFFCGAVFILTSVAHADVVWNDDFQSWQQNAGPFTTIGFDEVPSGTWVTEEYAHLGIHFTDGYDRTAYSPSTYISDGYGLIGWEEIMLVFDQPITVFGASFPGSMEVEFFSEGELIYHSLLFGSGPLFIGFISDVPFDQVRVFDSHDDHVGVDNLYFGPPIPAPSATLLLGVAALARGRRRRREVSP